MLVGRDEFLVLRLRRSGCCRDFPGDACATASWSPGAGDGRASRAAHRSAGRFRCETRSPEAGVVPPFGLRRCRLKPSFIEEVIVLSPCSRLKESTSRDRAGLRHIRASGNEWAACNRKAARSSGCRQCPPPVPLDEFRLRRLPRSGILEEPHAGMGEHPGRCLDHRIDGGWNAAERVQSPRPDTESRMAPKASGGAI